MTEDFDPGQLPVSPPGMFRLAYALSRLHLSEAQYEELVWAAEHAKLGGSKPTGRSGATRSEQATYSRMLRNLERRGLIERLTDRPGTRRTRFIRITEAGTALLRRVPDLVDKAR